MSDEINKLAEEEYNFADQEQAGDPSTVFSEQKTVPGSRMNQALLKKSLLIGGAVVLIFLAAGNFIAGLFSTELTQEVETVQTVPPAPEQAVQPVPDPALQTAPATVQPALPTAPQAVDGYNEMQQLAMAGSDLDQIFFALAQQEQKVNGQMEAVLANVVALNERLDDLENKLTDLSGRLGKVNGELQQQKKQLTYLQTPSTKAVAATAVPAKEAEQRETYYVQAIVPGRAWLKTKSGKTLTVREGSTVPGYGAVDHIDQQQGKVIMNSGESIIYSPDDS